MSGVGERESRARAPGRKQSTSAESVRRTTWRGAVDDGFCGERGRRLAKRPGGERGTRHNRVLHAPSLKPLSVQVTRGEALISVYMNAFTNNTPRSPRQRLLTVMEYFSMSVILYEYINIRNCIPAHNTLHEI